MRKRFACNLILILRKGVMGACIINVHFIRLEFIKLEVFLNQFFKLKFLMSILDSFKPPPTPITFKFKFEILL